jgi:predicted transcriptional regulator
MKIVGVYSFNNGKETIDRKYPHLFKEVEKVIKRGVIFRCCGNSYPMR